MKQILFLLFSLSFILTQSALAQTCSARTSYILKDETCSQSVGHEYIEFDDRSSGEIVPKALFILSNGSSLFVQRTPEMYTEQGLPCGSGGSPAPALRSYLFTDGQGGGPVATKIECLSTGAPETAVTYIQNIRDSAIFCLEKQ